MVASIGIDFGTTNTVLALAQADGSVATARFTLDGTTAGGCRTVLTFTPGDAAAAPVEVEIGPWAIRRYLAAPAECRFVQSPKSYLGSRLFQETRIYGRAYKLEDIVAAFLGELTARAEGLDGPVPACVAGRPVTFWGSDPDDGLAMARLRAAYGEAGLGRPGFAYEPVAASYYFATRLTQDATVLVADLGGGTTDYSVIRYGIGDGPPRVTPIAHRGVGIGGDRFDFRIVQNAVAPLVGKGTGYRSFGKRFDIPAAYFNRIANWHEFSFLRTPEVLRDLRQLARQAEAPERLERLLALVDGNLGFHLNHRVTAAKAALSAADSVVLSLADLDVDIACEIARNDFDDWIADDLAELERHLDLVLDDTARAAGQVDVVFMTGGSSLVPAVRRLFERRFGADRIQAGDEFQSVAKGLALIGLADDRRAWTYDGV
ncbi:MAG: Hsp70 family protein [Thalassobaculum sp.]|uniref:Hsp70 family protein n=1 Tax=Thalassobaculum sp. TaxID=2022740 RepID=UPI0032EF8A87